MVISSDISDIFGVISISYFKLIKYKLNNIVNIINDLFLPLEWILKILLFQSRGKNKSLIILTILLSLYFINLNYEIDITPKISEISDEIIINTFHIKYSKSLH